jgi:hypothetical protein
MTHYHELKALLTRNVNPDSFSRLTVLSWNHRAAPECFTPIGARNLASHKFYSSFIEQISNGQPYRLRRQTGKFKLCVEILGLLCRVVSRTAIFIHLLESHYNVGCLKEP